MDRSKVEQLAARHRTIERVNSCHREEAGRRDPAWVEELDACWNQLGAECQAFCAAYNTAMSDAVIQAQLHADTIVIRGCDEPQETVTFTRKAHGAAGRPQITARRYSPGLPPSNLHVETRLEQEHLVLFLQGRRTSTDEAVLLLLERLTENLARTCQRRN